MVMYRTMKRGPLKENRMNARSPLMVLAILCLPLPLYAQPPVVNPAPTAAASPAPAPKPAARPVDPSALALPGEKPLADWLMPPSERWAKYYAVVPADQLRQIYTIAMLRVTVGTQDQQIALLKARCAELEKRVAALERPVKAAEVKPDEPNVPKEAPATGMGKSES
jgi:hypothetical protein